MLGLINGTFVSTWHVDDHDDHYVEASSSAESDDVLLVARCSREVVAVVMQDVTTMLTFIENSLSNLAAKSRSESP